MRPPHQIASAARIVRMLYGTILAGLVAIEGTCVLALRLSPQPPPGESPRIGLVIAALPLALLGVAIGGVRARIPERRPDQSPDSYWSDASTRGAAIVLWAVVEVAGLLAAIGYFRTRGVVPAAALALALATMMLVRPARLEADGAP